MQMSDEDDEEKSETAADSYPIILRSYEPVADLDDRLKRIYAVLSLPPLEELNAPEGMQDGQTGTTSFASYCWDSSGTHVVSL
jgi:hypothetical protein